LFGEKYWVAGFQNFTRDDNCPYLIGNILICTHQVDKLFGALLQGFGIEEVHSKMATEPSVKRNPLASQSYGFRLGEKTKIAIFTK